MRSKNNARSISRRARRIAIDRELGERLCLIRRQLGITEQEAAADLDVSVRTYRKYEAGQGAGSISGWRYVAFADKANIRV